MKESMEGLDTLSTRLEEILDFIVGIAIMSWVFQTVDLKITLALPEDHRFAYDLKLRP